MAALCWERNERGGAMAYDGIDDYATAGAGDLAIALADRRVSAVELFEAAVSRIEQLDGAINAVVVRDFDRGREAAVAADAALARGERRPLLGVPMTVKEAFNVAGLPTTWGLEAARDWIADTDATVVARLKAAGAVIVGKTNVPPNLADWQSANPVYGRTVNPHDHTRSPGGSSGGSAAALAAGMVPLEFGSDIGGSIRVPSAFSGVCGHKPSFGLVPSRGHAPPGLDGLPPLLNVVGPMARRVGDLELALSITAGPEPEEAVGYRVELPPPRHERLADFRILILDAHPLAPLDGEIRTALGALADRLEATGARVFRRSEALPDLIDAHEAYLRMLLTALSYGAPPGPQTPSFHAWMDMQNHQLRTRRRWADLFETLDAVIAPTLGMPAFPHMPGDWGERRVMIDGEPHPFADQLAWVGMATYANLPATAVPIGVTAGGLPIGAQIIGPYLEDRTTLALARLLERA
jgi:amidase